MRHTKVIFIATVVLVLSAGVVVGRLSAKLPAAVPPTRGDPPSWLADQLNLTADQHQRMDAIWAETKQKMDHAFDGRHTLDKEREQAIRALLTPEQKTAYDKIQSDFRAKRGDAERERDRLIHDAVERSRALLDDGQKKKWDVLTKEMHEHHGPHGGPPGMRPGSRPADEPWDGPRP